MFVTTAGYFLSNGKPDGTHVTLFNQGYPANVAPGTVITNPQQVGPAGLRGTDGTGSLSTLNTLSPTIQKADLLVDNGANAPAASVVRFGVGTDGKALVADSTQPTGLNYKTVTPNSIATDKAIARYNGTAGTPIPVQDSGMVITDDGALQSSGTGGNARGVKAVDLQVSRTNVANVASGQTSTIAGGSDNKATGINASVIGGSGNAATNNNSTIGGGLNNTASGVGATVEGGNANSATNTTATVGGGIANTASGQSSTVAGGSVNVASGSTASIGGGGFNAASGQSATVAGGVSNTASGSYSSVTGGTGAIADKYGQRAFASGNFVTPGDAQKSELIWRIATTDATANVQLFLDGAAGTQRAVVPLNTTWSFEIITTIRTSAGVSVMIQTLGAIQNNAGTVTLVAAVTQTVVADGSGATITTANLTVDADNVQKTLRIRCTGIAATLIRWVSHARLVECNF